MIDIIAINFCRSILIEHAEVALHDNFGNKQYWKARRSMRFNKQLTHVAAEFRKTFLNSTDNEDNTILPDDWSHEKVCLNVLIIGRYKYMKCLPWLH